MRFSFIVCSNVGNLIPRTSLRGFLANVASFTGYDSFTDFFISYKALTENSNNRFSTPTYRFNSSYNVLKILAEIILSSSETYVWAKSDVENLLFEFSVSAL